MFSLGVMATFLWFMAGPAAHRKDTLVDIGLTLLNLAWIPLLAGYLLIMLDLEHGTQLVIAVIGLTFVFDTAAFLGGSVCGWPVLPAAARAQREPEEVGRGLGDRHAHDVVVSVALVTSFVRAFEDMKIESLLLAIVVSAAATLGDLAESLVKRDLAIKDMGTRTSRARGRARPHRLAAVRGTGRIPAPPRDLRLICRVVAPHTTRSSPRRRPTGYA